MLAKAFVKMEWVFTCLKVPELRAQFCQPVDTTSSLSLPHVSQSLNRQSCSKSNLQRLNLKTVLPVQEESGVAPIIKRFAFQVSMKHRVGQDKHVRCAGHRRRLQVFP